MPDRKRKKYHTNIKIAAKLEILPLEFKKAIPKSTYSRFVNTDYSAYFGIELGNNNDTIELLQKFAKDNTGQKFYKAYIVCKSILIRCFVFISRNINIKIKKKLVYAVEKFRGILGFEKVLKILKLTKYRFYAYFDQVKHQCKDSLFKLCKRTHPNQLTSNEVAKMKELLEKPEFMGWPVFSVAFYAKANNIITASVNTCYKYAKILDLQRFRKKKQYDKKKIGIRALQPHEIWQANVTIIKTMDNIKSYIYFVIDNFSKYILSYRVALILSASIRLETIKEASDKFLLPVKPEKAVNLLVDGGSENNNEICDIYMTKNKEFITKSIAQLDVEFSNSAIEALNRVIKHRYLFFHDIPDFTTLSKFLDLAVEDYYNKCPHITHKGLTPLEVLEGKTLDIQKYNTQIVESFKNRIEENRKANCGVCQE